MTVDYQVARTATLKAAGVAPESRALGEWDDLDAYVLLAEPGGGKSEAFKREARESAGSAVYVTARDLLTLGPPGGWTSTQTLFIDAMDERRSDASASITTLDELRKKLRELGRPKFRLSCREADWFSGGLEDLSQVARNGEIFALWLDPLSDGQVADLLDHWTPARLKDPSQFLAGAAKNGMAPLLSNPLLLNMLVDVVAENDWPTTRHDTYELACRRMAAEHNEVRLALAATTLPLLDDTLDAAGRLCAVLLLSDSQALANDANPHSSAVVQVRELPLGFVENTAATQACLKTKLFLSQDGLFVPRHRTIAEYLAAKAIAKQIASRALPISRVLSLMCGAQERTIEPLRALYGWLALHSAACRADLLDRDPLAIILYGDVRPFLPEEKAALLRSLHREGRIFRYFRNQNWDAQPFGALATADMHEVLRSWLLSGARDPAQHAVLECVADAIKNSSDELSLDDDLERVVRDPSYESRVRESMLDAWLSNAALTDGAKFKRLLDDIYKNEVEDESDELAGSLLEVLYPRSLTTAEAMQYARAERRENFIGNYRMFWASDFLHRVPEKDLPFVADSLVATVRGSAVKDEDPGEDGDHETGLSMERLALRVVTKAIDLYGTSVEPARIYRWLGIGVNQYGTFDSYEEEAKLVSEWLSQHPEQRREIYRVGLRQVQANSRDGKRHFYTVEERMFRSRRPRQWARWLLEMAADADDAEMSRYCYQEAAHAVVSRHYEHDLDVRDLEVWVDKYAGLWSDAEQWKLEILAWSTNSYQQKEHARAKSHRAKFEAERRKRKLQFAPHLKSLETGVSPPWVLDAVAGAFAQRVGGVQGDTPTERIQDVLVVDESQAQKVVHGLKLVLDRADIPTADKIFATAREGNRLYVGWAYLVGADLAHKSNPQACRAWSAALCECLLALHCVDQWIETPWFGSLAASQPSLVSRILIQHAADDLARGTDPQSRELYRLREQDAPRQVAREVLPALWALTPASPNEGQRRFFENVTLRASILHLDADVWRDLVSQKLSQAGLSAPMRIALNIVATRFDAATHGKALIESCASDPSGVDTLAEALAKRGEGDLDSLCNEAGVAGHLAELLLRGTSFESSEYVRDYGVADSRRKAGLAILRTLAASKQMGIGAELRRLRDANGIPDGWSVVIDGLLSDHARISNVASYRPASSLSVARVLANGTPTNSRDLGELAREHFKLVARKIRYDEANLLRMFYRGSGFDSPRIENECRDALLGLTSERLLPIGVQFGKENSYVLDKRADMQASCVSESRRLVVPIEVKKDNHPEVWTAWREQLEQRYMTNPDAQGIGIYLVLWFGDRTKSAPDRTKPRSAEEMAAKLSALIPADRANHIVGLVVDLSRPQ